MVMFTVGRLSVLNTIARAYNKNLLLICVVGGPIRMTTAPTGSSTTPLAGLISAKSSGAFRPSLVIRLVWFPSSCFYSFFFLYFSKIDWVILLFIVYRILFFFFF